MSDEIDFPILSADERQAARLANSPPILRPSMQRLAYECALELDEIDAIFERYGYSEAEAIAIVEDAEFKRLYDVALTDVRENGATFRTKCKAQAEDLLQHSYEIATDPEASPAVRADLIKWTAKMAGFEPKADKDDKGGAASGLTIAITFAGQPEKVIVGEPLTIESK